MSKAVVTTLLLIGGPKHGARIETGLALGPAVMVQYPYQDPRGWTLTCQYEKLGVCQTGEVIMLSVQA